MKECVTKIICKGKGNEDIEENGAIIMKQFPIHNSNVSIMGVGMKETK